MTRHSPEPSAQAHPLVKFLYDRLKAEDLPRYELEKRAGLGSNTIAAWWDAERAIMLQNMEAALGALGYGLVPKLLVEKIPIKIMASQTLKTRSGLLAHVERIEGRRAIGHLIAIRLNLEWDLAGRRIPAAGEDPFDLIIEVEKKEDAK